MQLFWQALTIMTLGMTLVFFFLFVLILCVRLSARIVRRYEAPEEAESDAGLAPFPAAAGHATALVAALAVAVAEHRRRRN